MTNYDMVKVLVCYCGWKLSLALITVIERFTNVVMNKNRLHTPCTHIHTHTRTPYTHPTPTNKQTSKQTKRKRKTKTTNIKAGLLQIACPRFIYLFIYLNHIFIISFI